MAGEAGRLQQVLCTLGYCGAVAAGTVYPRVLEGRLQQVLFTLGYYGAVAAGTVYPRVLEGLTGCSTVWFQNGLVVVVLCGSGVV